MQPVGAARAEPTSRALAATARRISLRRPNPEARSFEALGMRGPAADRPIDQDCVRLPPWVSCTDKTYAVGGCRSHARKIARLGGWVPPPPSSNRWWLRSACARGRLRRRMKANASCILQTHRGRRLRKAPHTTRITPRRTWPGIGRRSRRSRPRSRPPPPARAPARALISRRSHEKREKKERFIRLLDP